MKGKRLSIIFLIYLIIGFFFATAYDIYYSRSGQWGLSGFLSPAFFFVMATWPFQIIGLFKDVIYYGPQGKPF